MPFISGSSQDGSGTTIRELSPMKADLSVTENSAACSAPLSSTCTAPKDTVPSSKPS